MTNNEFDADVEQLDEEFDQADNTGMEDDISAAAPIGKKSGGGFGKILLILILLGGAGAAGAAKMGFVKLPFDIPGLTPPAPVKQATNTPPQPAPIAKNPTAESKDNSNTKLSVNAEGALPAAVVAEKKPAPELPAPELKQAPLAPPTQMIPTFDQSGNSVAAPVENSANGADTKKDSASMLMPQAIGTKMSSNNTIASPMGDSADPLADTKPAIAAPPVEQKQPEPPVVAATIPAPDTSALEGRISALETKIGALESQLNDLSSNQVKKSDISALQSSIDKLQSQVAAGAVVSHHTASVPVTAAPHMTHHAAAKPIAAPAVSTHWVLKSAKPGTAWVAPQGSGDMRTVSVGDTLAGIGKITDVSKGADGLWVVTGTRGKINQ